MHPNLMTPSARRLCERQIAVFAFESFFAVQLHVLAQQFPPRKIIPANATRKWSFARMLWPHMIVQMSRQNEGSLANGAFVRFDVVVALHVAPQMAGRHKRYATQIAFIRLVFHVDAHVNGHVVRLIERFATQFALVWLQNRK